MHVLRKEKHVGVTIVAQLVLVLSCSTAFARSEQKKAPQATIQAPAYQSFAQKIPAKIAKNMKRYSWRSDCPVPLRDLRYVKLRHWGYDEKPHWGELIVHHAVVADVQAIFKQLYLARFPIYSMKLIQAFEGSDERSMAANNTSAFNCRMMSGKKNVFSRHSFGLAIDINPLVNPYVGSRGVFPPQGKAYKDRSQSTKGLIKAKGVCVKQFLKHKWKWGGHWRSIKDYQHFEKKRSVIESRRK